MIGEVNYSLILTGLAVHSLHLAKLGKVLPDDLLLVTVGWDVFTLDGSEF